MPSSPFSIFQPCYNGANNIVHVSSGRQFLPDQSSLYSSTTGSWSHSAASFGNVPVKCSEALCASMAALRQLSSVLLLARSQAILHRVPTRQFPAKDFPSRWPDRSARIPAFCSPSVKLPRLLPEHFLSFRHRDAPVKEPSASFYPSRHKTPTAAGFPPTGPAWPHGGSPPSFLFPPVCPDTL